MNLHSTILASRHDLSGSNSQNDYPYECSCGWSGHDITEHAIKNGIIETTGSLFYCRAGRTEHGQTRNPCYRILPVNNSRCPEHAS